ncbi:MAG: glycosyltransferase family protein [Flavitalea sp.]
MKILYSVQATGNGHISRAMELLPYLEKYGNVEIFLSGENSSLALDAPIKYRSKGLSLFYTCNGTLDYWKLAKSISLLRLNKEVRNLPVEKYDLILNDFECITSLACAHKKVPSVNFGHQASFMSPNTPRPVQKNALGEWVLKNYAKASRYIGLHFESYDDFILNPVIKNAVLEAEPVNKGHITVYLPGYCDHVLQKFFKNEADFQFQVFSGEINQIVEKDNLKFIPVNNKAFNQSLVSCAGIITGAGFETPSEALHLKKKLIAIPIKGQYEQQCNAAALKKMGVKILEKMDETFHQNFHEWINESNSPTISFPHSTEYIVDFLMAKCTGAIKEQV